MKKLSFFLLAIGLLVAPQISKAQESCSEVFLENSAPQTDHPTVQLCNDGFAVGFSTIFKQPLWSAEYLTREMILQASHLHYRSPFHDDQRIKATGEAHQDDYHMSVWTRGHMTPSGDMPTRHSRFQTFAFSNIVPQDYALNTGKWEHLEQKVRNQVVEYGEAYVVTGPVFLRDLGEVGKDHIKVPSSLWKAVYIPKTNHGYITICKNEKESQCHTISSDELKSLTGITLNF